MSEKQMKWIRAAFVRAVKTWAQTAVGMVTVGAAASELSWMRIASVANVAAACSLLTSLAGLPEVDE